MPRTDELKVTVGSGRGARSFDIPAAKRRKLEDLIQALEDEGSVPAVQVLPELADDNRRPAMMLRGSRHKAEMTQADLAHKLKIGQHHISEMENGKRSISKKMARNLAVVLACDYRVFL